MEEKITLCGDNCIECPRYNAHTDEELKAVAELWYKVGWRACVVSNEEIVEICKNIGSKLSEKFKDKFPVVIGVLKGAAPFHAELIKHMDIDLEVDYVQVKSYVGKESSGTVKLFGALITHTAIRNIISAVTVL